MFLEERTIDSHIKRIRRKFRVSDPEFDELRRFTELGISITLTRQHCWRLALSRVGRRSGLLDRQELRCFGRKNRFWPSFISPLSARILAIMLFPLALFFIGLFSIDQYRSVLVQLNLST